MKKHYLFVFLLAMCSQSSSTQDVMNQVLAQDESVTILPNQLQWQRLIPDLKERSPEFAILLTSDVNGGTNQLFLRIPKYFRLKTHRHAGNETMVVVNGTVISQCQMKQESLGPGSFKYFPAEVERELWTLPDAEALLLLTLDSDSDIKGLERLYSSTR